MSHDPRLRAAVATFAVDGRPDLSMVVYNPATTDDAARVQSLIEAQGKTVPIPLQQADLVGSFANKNEYVATERVLGQFLAYQAGQRVDTTAHIGEWSVEKIAATGREG